MKSCLYAETSVTGTFRSKVITSITFFPAQFLEPAPLRFYSFIISAVRPGLRFSSLPSPAFTISAFPAADQVCRLSSLNPAAPEDRCGIYLFRLSRYSCFLPVSTTPLQCLRSPTNRLISTRLCLVTPVTRPHAFLPFPRCSRERATIRSNDAGASELSSIAIAGGISSSTSPGFYFRPDSSWSGSDLRQHVDPFRRDRKRARMVPALPPRTLRSQISEGGL